MEKQTIEKYLKKEATFVLASGRHYTGEIYNISQANKNNNCVVEIRDNKGNFVRFHSDDIQAIEIKGGQNESN